MFYCLRSEYRIYITGIMPNLIHGGCELLLQIVFSNICPIHGNRFLVSPLDYHQRWIGRKSANHVSRITEGKIAPPEWFWEHVSGWLSTKLSVVEVQWWCQKSVFVRGVKVGKIIQVCFSARWKRVFFKTYDVTWTYAVVDVNVDQDFGMTFSESVFFLFILLFFKVYLGK